MFFFCLLTWQCSFYSCTLWNNSVLHQSDSVTLNCVNEKVKDVAHYQCLTAVTHCIHIGTNRLLNSVLLSLFHAGPCHPNPCHNRGTCEISETYRGDTFIGYVCKCPPGFSGVHCQHSKSNRSPLLAFSKKP